MHSFTSDEFYEVTGRGRCAAIDKSQIPEGMWDVCDLRGQRVLINGEEFLCRGVETFAICRSERAPYRLNFSILMGD